MTGIEVVQPDAEYQRFLAQGRLMIQRAVSSGAYVFYPRVVEPGTGDALVWVEALGTGHVYATTTARARPPAADYNIALVELDEGVRMMSRVVGVAPAEVKIGMAVRARIDRDEQGEIVVFVPVAPE